MSPSKFDSTGEASTSCLLPENGVSNSYSLFSEKAADGLLQSPVQGSDDHLVEFSEALRIVAKALRHAAEGKASAQAEAAEWKRKYELERAWDLQMECKEHGGDFDDARMGNLVNQPVWCSEANEQLEKCCGRNGLCSDEFFEMGKLILIPRCSERLHLSSHGAAKVKKVISTNMTLPPLKEGI